jgi:bud site selection protein 20
MPALRGSTSVKKTRRHTRDLDQIHSDLHTPQHLASYLSTKAREDLPGFGQYYCKECAKWFESDLNLVKHEKGKPHRRRVKLLLEEPYSQKEAEAAVGLGTDNGKRVAEGEMEMMEMEEEDEGQVKEGV